MVKRLLCGAAAIALSFIAYNSIAYNSVTYNSVAWQQVTARTPQLDNEHVEVWKTVIAPRQPLTMHRHDHPRVIVALRGGTLRVVNENGQAHDVTWEAGRAYWLDADPPGELHGDVNEGAEPIEVMVVQLKGVGGGVASESR
jgi:quercetin dioxygenase-like cupin family protein